MEDTKDDFLKQIPKIDKTKGQGSKIFGYWGDDHKKGRKKMKIGIPVNERSMEKGICPSFGRASFFLIYDTETKEGEYLENFAVSSQGGAGIKAAQAVVNSGAKALITPRCGENAASVIRSGDIKIYKSIGTDIEDNIEAFLREELSVLDEIHEGSHGHGGN